MKEQEELKHAENVNDLIRNHQGAQKRLEDNYQAQMCEREHNHMLQLQNIQQQTNSEIARIQMEVAAQTAVLINENTQLLNAKFESKKAKEIENFKQTMEAMMSRLRDDQKEAEFKQREQFEFRYAVQKEEYEAEVKQMKTEYEARLEDLDAAHEETLKKNQAGGEARVQEIVDEVKSEHAAKFETLEGIAKLCTL